MADIAAPRSERPLMPEGYGLPSSTEGLLAWADVEVRLVSSMSYWLATVRPDGRPHVVPRWGVWLEGRFWYDGAPTTVHAQNLNANPLGRCGRRRPARAHADAGARLGLVPRRRHQVPVRGVTEFSLRG